MCWNAEPLFLAIHRPWWYAEIARPSYASLQVGVLDSLKAALSGERVTKVASFTLFASRFNEANVEFFFFRNQYVHLVLLSFSKLCYLMLCFTFGFASGLVLG